MIRTVKLNTLSTESICRNNHRRCSMKNVFLKIWQNSQENTCVRVSFVNKIIGWGPQLYLKRDWRRCFPVNFAKFLRTPFLQNTSGRLFLQLKILYNFSAVSIFVLDQQEQTLIFSSLKADWTMFLLPESNIYGNSLWTFFEGILLEVTFVRFAWYLRQKHSSKGVLEKRCS